MIDLKDIKSSVRHLEEMKDLIFDQAWLKTADPKTGLYYVWRNVAENDQDKEKIKQAGLRYDITEFAPLMLGVEFNKTYGHIHSLVPKTNIAYPEIYEVLQGEAYFFFQKFKNNKVKDAFAVHCLAGDKCVIKPGYSHITINPTNKKMVMANWLAVAGQTSYKEILKNKGGCYYAIKDNSEKIKWVKNQTYSSTPQLKFLEPNNMAQFNISKDQPLYNLVNTLEKLDFLQNPQKYDWS